MRRYELVARAYDATSAEAVYRPGRVAAIADLGLAVGDRVLDVGCGTGLNFALLHAAVGPQGSIVGLDASPQMLRVAGDKARRGGWDNVRLVCADATDGDAVQRSLGDPALRFDALIASYALSLMPDWPTAWRVTTALLWDQGRATVVDMQPPVGRARILTPLARLACLLGGSDITAAPWTALEREGREVLARSLRGGHIQVRTGTLTRR